MTYLVGDVTQVLHVLRLFDFFCLLSGNNLAFLNLTHDAVWICHRHPVRLLGDGVGVSTLHGEWGVGLVVPKFPQL